VSHRDASACFAFGCIRDSIASESQRILRVFETQHSSNAAAAAASVDACTVADLPASSVADFNSSNLNDGEVCACCALLPDLVSIYTNLTQVEYCASRLHARTRSCDFSRNAIS
jgi:hypothetical protein